MDPRPFLNRRLAALSTVLWLTGCGAITGSNDSPLQDGVEGSLATQFLVNKVEPAAAQPGDEVTIHGVGLDDASLTYDGLSMEVVTRSSEAVTVVVPDGTPGLVNIDVTKRGETSNLSFLRLNEADQPTVMDAPASEVCEGEVFYDVHGNQHIGEKDCRDYVERMSCVADQVLSWSDDTWKCTAVADLVPAIESGSINSAELGDAAVTTAKLADAAVTTAKLADGSITSVKIAAGAIDLAHLGDMSCVAGQIIKWNAGLAVWECAADDAGVGTSVALAEMEADSVDSSKIVNGSIALADLSATICSANEILKMNGAGTALTCAADDAGVGNSVALAEMEANSVDSSKIVNGSIALADLSATICSANEILKMNGAGTALTCAADDAGVGNSVALAEMEANSVDSSKIVNGSIALADLSATICSANEILKMNGGGTALVCAADDDGVGSSVALAEMEANSVDSSKIVNGSIALADLSATICSANEILKMNGGGTALVCAADDAGVGSSVALAEMEANSVDSSKIVNGSIALADLSATICSANEILKMNGGGTALVCAADDDGVGSSVALAEMEANSVDSSKIVNGSIALADLSATICSANEILKMNGGGTALVCATEADPKIGTLTDTKYCTASSGVINCTSNGTGSSPDPTLTFAQAAGQTISTEHIRARDGSGLQLYEDSGTSGVFVEDSGEVGINEESPAFDLDVGGTVIADHYYLDCPTGYTAIRKTNGAELGCIEDDQRAGTDDCLAAILDCHDDVGGRLPTFAELYIADQRFSGTVSNAGSGNEWVDGIDDGKCSAMDSSQEPKSFSFSDNKKYRCFIPR